MVVTLIKPSIESSNNEVICYTLCFEHSCDRMIINRRVSSVLVCRNTYRQSAVRLARTF